VVIVDEGPPEPKVGHLKGKVQVTRNAFYDRALTSPVATDQLTAAKLDRLMDRYAGKDAPIKTLDFPDAEQSDVVRGLRTYATASPENARAFADLYSKLASARQALPGDVVKSLRPK
jgi:hypothetical protein